MRLKSLSLVPPLLVMSYDLENQGSFGLQAPSSLTWRKARPKDPEDFLQG